MKKLLFATIVSFLIVSCGLFQQDNSASQSSREREDIPRAAQPTPTVSPIPTATIDYQMTAAVAESTAEAAHRLMVEVTAAEDQRQHEQLEWTAVADQATIAAASLTMQSDQATAMAYPTYAHVTMTAQVEQFIAAKTQASDSRTALAATQNAPTLVIAMTQANVQAKYAETTEKVNLGVKAAIGFAIFCLALFILVGTIMRLMNGVNVSQFEPVEEIPQEQKPVPAIPLVTETFDGGVRMKRAEIPCSVDQLVELADGIINRGMSLGFNIWEGTPVHRSLQKVRDAFQYHNFAKLIKGGNGALDITAEGELFLRYVAEHKEPRPPFVCVSDQVQY